MSLRRELPLRGDAEQGGRKRDGQDEGGGRNRGHARVPGVDGPPASAVEPRFSCGCVGLSSPRTNRSISQASPDYSARIQPDQPRLLLLVIRSARSPLAEVPLADLSLKFFTRRGSRPTWRITSSRVAHEPGSGSGSAIDRVS